MVNEHTPVKTGFHCTKWTLNISSVVNNHSMHTHCLEGEEQSSTDQSLEKVYADFHKKRKNDEEIKPFLDFFENIMIR